MQGAEEVQLVRELHALVQQMPLQEAEDRGTVGGVHNEGSAGPKRECTDMVR